MCCETALKCLLRTGIERVLVVYDLITEIKLFGIEMNFNRDLFAFHTLPFAAYAEPVGYTKLTALAAPQQAHYEQYIPLTCAAARGLFAAITQHDEWGQQYVVRLPDGSEGGGWRTETAAHMYPTRGRHERRGKELNERQILRTLCRTGFENALGKNGVYALGRTDRHLPELENGLWKNGAFRTTRVSVLLIDIDMDIAWARNDIAPVRLELAVEREVATALHLPYRVFRTGRRGHQIVLPLSAPIDRSVAGWLIGAFGELLIPYHFQSGGQAKADCHNLSGLVRLAGGRHATTERVAFWIDPADASLFPIDRQLEMMAAGYRHPAVHPFEQQEFTSAADEIATFLQDNFYIAPHQYAASSVIRSLAFAAVVHRLPDNLIVARFRDAQERLALPDEDKTWEELDVYGGLEALEAAEVLSAGRNENGKIVSATQPTDAGSRTWATRIWEQDWPTEGVFWNWITEGGQRGITAAKRIFGEDNAERELLARIDLHPISTMSPAKARERRRVIKALYAKHRMPTLGSSSLAQLAGVELPEAAMALISEIMSRLHSVKPIQNRNRTDIEQLVTVLLAAFATDAISNKHGAISLSLDDLVKVMRTRWPGTAVNRDQAGRYLKRITAGNDTCGFALMERVGGGQGWTQAARYKAGVDLRNTKWGSALPVCGNDGNEVNPRAEAIHYRTWGGVYVFEPPKKRGRKPRAT